jgi:hypothetical protein
MTKKKQVGVRFDSNRTRLKTGETQRPNGTYAYRWSTPDGKRHSIYAPTLEKLREQEEQIIVDKHDGIRSDVKSITVNEMFNLWCQLKRGIKDSTFKNYIYMYELFVKPSFGKNRLVQVKKSDVRKFYNSLADGKVLKIATIDNVHNVLHQVFQVAVDDGMIRQNPTDNMLKELKLSHGFEREKKEALTVAQQKLFFDYMLSHPKDTHWYPVFYVMANTGMRVGDDDDKIRLNQRKPSKYKGLRRFGPEKNLQRINKFMKERPIFYKNLIQMKENIRFYLRCFYCITKVMILQFNSENRTELARNG